MNDMLFCPDIFEEEGGGWCCWRISQKKDHTIFPPKMNGRQRVLRPSWRITSPRFFFWRALRAFNAHWGAFQAAHTNTTLQGKHPSLLPPSGPSALARRVTTRGLDSSPRFWMLFSRLISWGGIDWIQSWWRSENANFSLEWVDSWRLSSIRWVAEGYIEAASINRSGPRCSAFSSVGASSESTAATLLLCISRSVRFVLSNCGLVISPVSSKFKKFKSKKHFATEILFVISV